MQDHGRFVSRACADRLQMRECDATAIFARVGLHGEFTIERAAITDAKREGVNLLRWVCDAAKISSASGLATAVLAFGSRRGLGCRFRAVQQGTHLTRQAVAGFGL